MQVVVFFELWRWLFFFAGLIAAYYVAYYCMQVVVVMIESQFFTFRQVLYYVIGIRVSSAVTMTSCGMQQHCQAAARLQSWQTAGCLPGLERIEAAPCLNMT